MQKLPYLYQLDNSGRCFPLFFRCYILLFYILPVNERTQPHYSKEFSELEKALALILIAFLIITGFGNPVCILVYFTKMAAIMVFIFILGYLAIVFEQAIPFNKAATALVTQLPPFMGILPGLGFIWIIMVIIHGTKEEANQ